MSFRSVWSVRYFISSMRKQPKTWKRSSCNGSNWKCMMKNDIWIAINDSISNLLNHSKLCQAKCFLPLWVSPVMMHLWTRGNFINFLLCSFSSFGRFSIFIAVQTCLIRFILKMILKMNVNEKISISFAVW